MLTEEHHILGLNGGRAHSGVESFDVMKKYFDNINVNFSFNILGPCAVKENIPISNSPACI